MTGTVAKIQCKCEHEQQDKMYGKNVRVANTTQRKPSPDTIEVRCTVCSKTQTIPVSRTH